MGFLRAGLLYGLGNIAFAAVPFLLLPILTRVLDPAGYGEVISFAMMMTLCSTVAGLSVHAALGVLWFRRPPEELPAMVGTAMVIVLVTTALVAACAASVVGFFPALVPGLTPGFAVAAAAAAGANVIWQARMVLWQGQEKPGRTVALQVSASLVNLGLSMAFVFLLQMGADGRNLGIAAAALLIGLVSLYAFVLERELAWQPSKAQLLMFWSFGAPLVLHSLAGVILGTADRWLVSGMLGAAALGTYGAAAQVGMMMTLAADAFNKAFGPWVYKHFASNTEHDKLMVVGAVYLTIPSLFVVAAVLVGFMAVAGELLLGPSFTQSLTLMPWFIFSGAVTGTYFCFALPFFYHGRTALLATCTVSAGLLGLLAVRLLIPVAGLQGAAMGFLAGQFVLMLAVFILGWVKFGLPWNKPIDAFRALRGEGKSAA